MNSLMFSRLSRRLGLEFDRVSSLEFEPILVEEVLRSLKAIDEVTLKGCLEKYSQCIVTRQRGKVCGLVFITEFSHSGEGYLYFGPAYYESRQPFVLTNLSFLEQSVQNTKKLNFLAEIQNPEVAIYWYVFFPRDRVTPSVPDFNIGAEARLILHNFSCEISHMQEVDIEQCKSRSKTSLFEKRHSSSLLQWLERNQVYLDQGENLLVLCSMDQLKWDQTKFQMLANLLRYEIKKSEFLSELSGEASSQPWLSQGFN